LNARIPAALFAPLLAAGAACAGDAERGRALYDSRCTDCHTESVHGRAKREATDFEAVRRWVTRWNDNLRLQWKDEEIEDVTVFLNATYYRFPCPVSACSVVSMNASKGNR